ncbi:hypothetical protein [Burkholderia ambifaria]|uniref:hypothetical protein n=1 Tax=Burkholderia ambifaria TaxID=152480 RepID=UPI0003116318|nr:hypothetical protein [Burkholderia ambifaria]
MPGEFAGSLHADGRLLDEASDRVRRAVCSFMIPPALIVDDWPVFRIVGQTLDIQLWCDISGTQVNRPCAPSFEPDFE